MTQLVSSGRAHAPSVKKAALRCVWRPVTTRKAPQKPKKAKSPMPGKDTGRPPQSLVRNTDE